MSAEMLRADASTYSGGGRVSCFDEYTNLFAGDFVARNWIVDQTVSAIVSETSCPKCHQQIWSPGTGGVSTAAHCYRSYVSGSSTFYSNQVASAAKCVPAPKPICPGDPSCPPTGSACLPDDIECQLSPIVINMGRGGYQLTGLDDPVTFDLDADGYADITAWTAADSDTAFLALDRNGNGSIDDGSELFGDATPFASGRGANGFEALAAFDQNADGSIDRRDPVWSSLLLWTDRNHDGMSQSAEIVHIAESEIVALGLRYQHVGRQDASGNTFRYKARLTKVRGADNYYDIFFSVLR